MKNTNNSLTLRWISDVAGRKKLHIGILLLVQMLLGASSVLYAMILRDLIDEAVEKNRQSFFFCVAAFIGLALFQILLRAVNRFLEEYAKATMENRFKERLFSHLLNRDFAKVSAVHSGEWMNRLTSDTLAVADGLVQIIPGTMGMLVKMAGALLMILILEPVFGYLLIPSGVLLLLLTYGFRKILKGLHKRVQEADGRLRIFLQESLGSMLVVRAFVKEEQTVKGALDRMEAHKKARMKKNHFSNICNVGFGGIMQGAYVLGAAYCGYGILIGSMSYGTLMAILQLISQIQSPLANISGYLPKYYAMLASAERLMEVEEYSGEGYSVKEYPAKEYPAKEYPVKEYPGEEYLLGGEHSPEGAVIKKTKLSMREICRLYDGHFNAITLEHAEFTYQPAVEASGKNMPVVLKNVNIKISKGDYIAFTGPSGCGKSTVLKLLLCLYPLDAGNRWIELTDSNGRRYDKNKNRSYNRIPLTPEYRRLFAYVPQGNHLMSGTIREIVTFADAAAMQEEKRIWKSLQIACAEVFVKQLELGIDTPIGERGAGLSEGQMQRIAIARALFADNPILILDESTSALDESTEEQLLTNLRAMTNKTVLIITHRTAALTICDKEVVFSGENVTMRPLIHKNNINGPVNCMSC